MGSKMSAADPILRLYYIRKLIEDPTVTHPSLANHYRDGHLRHFTHDTLLSEPRAGRFVRCVALCIRLLSSAIPPWALPWDREVTLYIYFMLRGSKPLLLVG